MFQLAENRQEAGRELRDCVVETLQELMKDDDKITALEADLGGASGFTKIKNCRHYSSRCRFSATRLHFS